MEENKKILLINYSFPPYPGIGGRRWAKFAKYLAKLGYQLHVISAENPFDYESKYTNDIKSDSINVYNLPEKYPYILSSIPKGIVQKIWYRISLVFMKIAVKGNYYDKAALWKDQLNKKSLELIKTHHIHQVIISGAPFSLLYFCLNLRKDMPQIKLYGDLRDPWTWGNGYGFKIISNRRKRIEILREKKVMQHFNKIFLPIESMVEYMKSNYPENANKIFLLPHAYDADDVNSIAEFTRKSIDGKINLIFYGALYDFLKKEMLFVAEMLAKQNNISLQIYSDTVSYAEIFAKHDILKKKVFYNKTVSVKKIFEKIRSSDFVLMIHPKDIYTNGITTKFYEIVSLRIPILFIGYDPFVKNFLEKNKLGIYINPQETVDLLPLLSEFKYNDRFDVEKHSFESVTKELINFIS